MNLVCFRVCTDTMSTIIEVFKRSTDVLILLIIFNVKTIDKGNACFVNYFIGKECMFNDIYFCYFVCVYVCMNVCFLAILHRYYTGNNY